jgi:AcrR family transcriptional regulator
METQPEGAPKRSGSAPKRSGSQTKEHAQRVATALFISQGFEATSLREIAEQLGISKASLYYHFSNKDAIVESIIAARRAEIDELVTWFRAQEAGSDLLRRTVLRWVESSSVDKLRGIRFANANPATMRRLRRNSADIGGGLITLAELAAGENAGATRLLLVKMAFLSINAAVMADPGNQNTDDDIVAAARTMALAILHELGGS